MFEGGGLARTKLSCHDVFLMSHAQDPVVIRSGTTTLPTLPTTVPPGTG